MLSGADWTSVCLGGSWFVTTCANFCLTAVFSFAVPFGFPWHCMKRNWDKSYQNSFLLFLLTKKVKVKWLLFRTTN